MTEYSDTMPLPAPSNSHRQRLRVRRSAALLAVFAWGCGQSPQAVPDGAPAAMGGGGGGAGGPMAIPETPANVDADVGTVAIRQLTIAEYNNTVRDLLGSKLQPANAFQSSVAAGFDTIAGAAIINSRKVADYFDAATLLADEAFADPAAQARLVTCQPAAAGDLACAKSIVETFGRRVFRRPLTPDESKLYVDQYASLLGLMVDHATAIKQVVRTLLVSPQFLYRMEFDADVANMAAHALSGYEVASRLSYTVWSSMPDDTALGLAERGELSSPAALQAEVDRLLQDGRSLALVENFAGQWLGSRRLNEHIADPTVYPEWNDGVRSSMQQELALYFDSFLHGTETYDHFLTSSFHFVDQNLAPLYGLPAPATPGFAQVQHAAGSHRVGFLGLAGFLAHTSRPERSAPSIRGQWVLDALTCLKLELPPNFTPPPLAEPQAGTSVRQQVEAHGGQPACAPCHTRLDPVGLSLEHFDGIGRYRETYADGVAIDTTATLPGGPPFDGLEGLAGVLSADPAFLTCAARKLFTYGLGRPFEAGDGSAPLVDQAVAGWKTSGLGLQNLLKQLVVSDAFRFRHPNP